MPNPIFRVMAKPDLTEEDYLNLAGIVRDAINNEPCRTGLRINQLRLLLGKLHPEIDRPLGPRPPAHVSAPLPGMQIDRITARGVLPPIADGPPLTCRSRWRRQ